MKKNERANFITGSLKYDRVSGFYGVKFRKGKLTIEVEKGIFFISYTEGYTHYISWVDKKHSMGFLNWLEKENIKLVYLVSSLTPTRNKITLDEIMGNEIPENILDKNEMREIDYFGDFFAC